MQLTKLSIIMHSSQSTAHNKTVHVNHRVLQSAGWSD